MNILFDIDGTITNETKFMIKTAPEYLRKVYGKNFPVVNPNANDVSDAFGIRQYLLRNNLPEKQIQLEIDKINTGFWNRYFVKYMFYPIKRDVAKTIRELQAKGYRICFVSLRGKRTHKNESGIQRILQRGIVFFLTIVQLRINGIRDTSVYLVETNREKIKVAEKLKPQYFFDDNMDVLEQLNDKDCVICIEAPHNRYRNSCTDIIKIPFTYKNIGDIVSGPVDLHR